MIYQPIKKASSLAGGSGRDVAAAGLSADIYGPLKSHRGGRNGQTIDWLELRHWTEGGEPGSRWAPLIDYRQLASSASERVPRQWPLQTAKQSARSGRLCEREFGARAAESCNQLERAENFNLSRPSRACVCFGPISARQLDRCNK